MAIISDETFGAESAVQFPGALDEGTATGPDADARAGTRKKSRSIGWRSSLSEPKAAGRGHGHAVATGDWFVLDQISTIGRSISLDLLPAEIVQRMVVHKTPSADLIEGGVAGSVDIQTRQPRRRPLQPWAERARAGGRYCPVHYLFAVAVHGSIEVSFTYVLRPSCSVCC